MAPFSVVFVMHPVSSHMLFCDIRCSGYFILCFAAAFLGRASNERTNVTNKLFYLKGKLSGRWVLRCRLVGVCVPRSGAECT